MLSFGPALLLDGVDDYATAADSASLDLGIGATEDFTIEAQFSVPDLSGEGRQAIIHKEGAYSLYADFHASQPDQISFQVWQGGNAYTVSAAASDLAVGWHHVAAVFDNEWTATQDQFAIYLDGLRVGVASNVDFSSGIDNSSSSLSIGSQGGTYSYHGWIDEVRFSDVVRYSGASYSIPSDAFVADGNTRALWQFDETPGATSFADASPNNNLLTGLNGARTAYSYSPTPSTPDLLDVSDSGVSSTDNLTNLDNSQASKALQFSVENTISGATVTIYADGVAIGSSVATGETTIITSNGSYDLIDGSHSIQAKQALPGMPLSDAVSGLFFNIDTTIPTFNVPLWVGAYDTSLLADDLTVVGSLVYLANREDGLQIINVSTPSAPVLWGNYNTSGITCGVAVVGTTAYLADMDAGLQIIDVSNPHAPVKLGQYDTSGYADGITVSGTMAYVADENAGLQIIDVSNPRAPFRVGGYDTSGLACDVAVSGTLAYVVDGSSGLQIIDVSNPAAPVRLGGCDTSGTACDIVVSGTLAYVADGEAGLEIIDISNPASPGLKGSYDTSGNAAGIALSGTHAFIADYTSGIQILDVSNPAAPVRIGNYLPADKPIKLALSGSLVYVADSYAGLQILDISTPVAPDLQRASDTGISDYDNFTSDNTPSFDISLSGDSFFRVYRNGVQISGDYETGTSYATSVQADGSYQYTSLAVDAAGNESHLSSSLLVTIDSLIPAAPDLLPACDSGVSNSDNVTNYDNSLPSKVLQFNIGNTVAGATVTVYADGANIGSAVATGNTTLVTTRGNFQLANGEHIINARQTIAGHPKPLDSAILRLTVDTTAPFVVSPQLAGSHDTDGFAHYITISNMRAYVADESDGLQIFDINNPSNPQWRGQYSNIVSVGDVAVSGTLAFMGAAGCNFWIFDVSNPSAPIKLGGNGLAGNVMNVAVSGTYAYVAADTGGLVIIDFANLTAPVPVGVYYSTNYGGAEDVVIKGSIAYVAATGGLEIIDVSNPTSPTCIGFYDNSGATSSVAVEGTIAYVATREGLDIMDVSNPTAPVKIGGYYTSGTTPRVTVVGSIACIADEGSGLKIIDVSNPAAPMFLGIYDTGGWAEDVAFSGSIAYVADGSDGLQIFDLRDAATLAAPDLQALSDTGTSDSDNLTGDNTPTFSVSLPSGSFLRFYKNGTQISGDYEVGPSFTTALQPDGTYNYSYRAVDAAGNVSGLSPVLAVTIDSTIPSSPDLLPAFDSGVSNSDNITNLDNSQPDKILQFDIGNTIPGVTVTLFADGIEIGSAVATGQITTITTNGSYDLADGIHTFFSRQTVPGKADPTDSGSVVVTIDTAIPFFANPSLLGGYDTSGGTVAVSVAGTIAYVADGVAGLQIIDVSNPTVPVCLGGYATSGSANGVALSGTLAYVADGNSGLQIIDVTNPTSPHRLGGYDTSGFSYKVAIAGTLAYVADGSYGLQIIDVSNPAAPVRLGGYLDGGNVSSVVLVGNLAYLADGNNGLQIIDVTNSTAPVRLGGYNTNGQANGIAISGTTAYIADGISGMCILDISATSNPVYMGGYDTPGSAFAVGVSGELAYVADWSSGLQIIDIGNPASLQKWGSYDTSGYATGIALSGSRIYIADGSDGILVFDTAIPSPPDLINDTGISNKDNITSGTTPTFAISVPSGYYYRFYCDGAQISSDYQTGKSFTTAVLPDGAHQFNLIVMDPAGNASPLSPTLTVIIDSAIPGVPQLLPATDSGFYNNDLLTNRDNSQPNLSLQFSVPSTIAGATVSVYADGMLIGSTLADGTTTTITTNGTVDLSDGTHVISARKTIPGRPESSDSAAMMITIDTTAPTGFLQGGYDTLGLAYGVATSGNIAYVADGSYGLQIIDISNPAAPVRMGGYDTTGTAYGVAVSGSVAYVADGGYGLQIINVSNPAAPVRLGGYDTYGTTYGVAVSGSVAYLADGSYGLEIINISNPASPVLLGSCDTLGTACSVVVVGNLAYVADGGSGLQIINVANPSAPVRLGGYDTAGYANALALNGTLVYVADEGDGLQIIDVSNPASPFRLGGYDTSGTSYGVSLWGTMAFVADGNKGLQVIDVGNPSSPSWNSECAIAGTARGICSTGSTAYLACYNSGLQITDEFTPAAPDLQSDYGISSTDNITCVNNPSFGIAFPSNAYYRFFSSNVQIGGDYLSGTTYALPAQPDGIYNYSIAVVDAAGNLSARGTPLVVTIDTLKPTVQVVPVTPDPRNSPLSSIDVIFNEPIIQSSFTYVDVSLTRDGSSIALNSSVTIAFVSGTTYRINGLANFTTNDGNYVLSVNATGIADVAGNLGSGTASDSWITNAGIPTDISLSSTTVAENVALGTVVGTLTTTDPTPGDSFTYSLVNGLGDDDNRSFAIDGNTLRTNAVLDFETKATYTVRLRTTDASGFWCEKAFPIAVIDQPETIAIGVNDWTDSGMTLTLGADGKLHFYLTGTTTDAIPPHKPDKVIGVSIVGRNIDDIVTDNYSGHFANLTVVHATLNLNLDHAFSAATNILLDGGVLNFNGHLTEVGDLTLINDGQANVTSVNNHSTTVTSGTLTATSIVCDAITIGSDFGTATNAVPANITNGVATQRVESRRVVADIVEPSTVANALIVPTSIDSPTIVEQPRIEQSIKGSVSTNAPTSASLIAPFSTLVVSQSISKPEIATEVQLPVQNEIKSSIVDPLSKELRTASLYADFNLRTKFDSQSFFSSPSLLGYRTKDSVYRELDDSLVSTKKQPLIALITSQSAHRLGLHPHVRDYQNSDAIELEDTELLIGKHFHKQVKLVEKAVDDFHADWVGAIE